jgi:SOS-response transcriptional repressor LexA
MIDRVRARLAVTGQSDREVSLLVSDGRNADVIRDMDRKGITPKGERLEKLAEVLETTVGWLRTGRTDTALIADRRTGFDAGPQLADLPRDLPVKGTALAHDLSFDSDGEVEIEAHMIGLEETIDRLRRPLILAGRSDVYAIYIQGTSMEPRFEGGDAIIVDTRRPPSPGDYVVVQLAEMDGEQDMRRMALIKRLVRRTATTVELQQFNPAVSFKVPQAKITAIHRVLSLADLLG